METNLAGHREGTAERYVPGLMRGELIEAEHLARYHWAAPLAKGKRVLDAGCGTAYGSVLLHEAGADSVIGVDIAESVLDAVRPEMPAGVSLEAGNLLELPLGDDSVDLVVCFETLEHFSEPDRVLDQLARVLAPDGALAVSSPNRDLSLGQNPYHYHEYTVSELRAALSSRFTHVALGDQRSFCGSLIAPVGSEARRIVNADGNAPESAHYLIGLASDAPLPAVGGVAALGAEVSWEQWTKSWSAQQDALDQERLRAEAAEARLADRDELQRRLVEAEQLLADVPHRERERTQAIAERDYALEWARARVAELDALHGQRTRTGAMVDRLVRALRRATR